MARVDVPVTVNRLMVDVPMVPVVIKAFTDARLVVVALVIRASVARKFVVVAFVACRFVMMPLSIRAFVI